MECIVVDISSEDEDCAPGRAGRLSIDWVDELLDRAVGRRMEESDDVLVLDGFSLPAVKRRRTNPEPLSLRKCENHDDDECLVLEVDPDKPAVVADEKVSGGFEEDDLLIVAEKGQVACRDYPHSRDQCATYPFTSSSHKEYCHLCHCYVCDSPAPCCYWGNGNLGTDHCHSTDKAEGWKSLRKLFKQKNMVTAQSLKLMNDSSFDNLIYRDAVPQCHSNLVSLRSSSLQPCSSILNSDATNFVDQGQPYIVSSHRQRFSQPTTRSSLNPRLRHLQNEVHLPSLTSQLMHQHKRSRSGSLQAGSTIMANHFQNNVSHRNHISEAVQQMPTCATVSSQAPHCHQGQLRSEDVLVLSPVIPDQMQTTLSSQCTVAQFESSKLPLITAKDIVEKSWEDLLPSLASELEDPIRCDFGVNDIIMANQTPTQNGQIMLRIIDDSFTPNGHSVSAFIIENFKERQCTSGYTWKYVDQDMKEFYYREFLKKYIWEEGHEAQFKTTWNLYCQKQYNELLYKWRKKETKPSHVRDEIWESWQRIWTMEKWQQNSIIARSNRNSEVTVPDTGVTKHTVGSRSIVEHAIQLEGTLEQPSNSSKLFCSTHLQKEDTFVDTRSKVVDNDMIDRVAQASQPTIEGWEAHTSSHDTINDMYYDVVGGPKKNSLYGLGSQSKVIFDRQLCTPRFRGHSTSLSVKIQALEMENETLRARITTIEQSMQDFMSHFELSRSLVSPSAFPTLYGFNSQETEDPKSPDE